VDKKRPQIVCVTAGGPYPWAVINHIGDVFGPLTVLVEQPEPKLAFLKRRARKIGWLQTAGQFATMVWGKFGKRFARAREQALIDQFQLRTTPDSHHTLIHINSINGDDAKTALKALQPDVVFLTSCRIVSKSTLSALHCPVINYHAGINPKYRGLNSGYFARANNDCANFGTTVHLVDVGVDTGSILYQQRIADPSNDTILTYAMLMAAHSREICAKAVGDALTGNLKPQIVDLPSQQWFHPPIWAYLWTGLTKGIW
jgi:folate-dependent phosphoribosylglycinamide formyltransferase PurN